MGERDTPNGGGKPEFGGGWWWSSDEAQFSSKSFSKFFQTVLGCSDCFGGFLEVIRRFLGEQTRRRRCPLVQNCGVSGWLRFQRKLGGGFMVEVGDDCWKKVS